MNFLAYTNGINDLIDIAKHSNLDIQTTFNIFDRLKKNKIIYEKKI